MRGLELDFARLRKAHEEDAWWIAQGEELTGPHGFKEVLKVLLAGGSPVQVVHASGANRSPPGIHVPQPSARTPQTITVNSISVACRMRLLPDADWSTA